MYRFDYSPTKFPDSSFTIQLLNPQQYFDAVHATKGVEYYEIFAGCVKNWKNAPLFVAGADGETVCAEFDALEIQNLDPMVVKMVVNHAITTARMSVDEIKNLQSQLKSAQASAHSTVTSAPAETE